MGVASCAETKWQVRASCSLTQNKYIQARSGILMPKGGRKQVSWLGVFKASQGTLWGGKQEDTAGATTVMCGSGLRAGRVRRQPVGKMSIMETCR